MKRFITEANKCLAIDIGKMRRGKRNLSKYFIRRSLGTSNIIQPFICDALESSACVQHGAYLKLASDNIYLEPY